MKQETKKYSLNEIVFELIGNLSWYGESNHDNKVGERLPRVFDLLTDLLSELYDLVNVETNYQASAKSLGKQAREILESISEDIESVLSQAYTKRKELEPKNNNEDIPF